MLVVLDAPAKMGRRRMKISLAEAIPLTIPFNTGGAQAGWMGQAWKGLDVVLIRLETKRRPGRLGRGLQLQLSAPGCGRN